MEYHLFSIVAAPIGQTSPPQKNDSGTIGEVGLVVNLDGDGIFQHYHDLIVGAEREILLQTFQWHLGSEPAKRIRDAVSRG